MLEIPFVPIVVFPVIVLFVSIVTRLLFSYTEFEGNVRRQAHMQKAPDIINTRGKSSHIGKCGKDRFPNMLLFSHPDYTVGSGFTPDQLLPQLTDFPTHCGCGLHRPPYACRNHRRSGICRNLCAHHPAPKNSYFIVQASIKSRLLFTLLILCTMM